MILQQRFCRFRLAPVKVKNETHAAAGHAAEHPKSPEVRAKFLSHRANEHFREGIARPRNDRLDGLAKILGGQFADAVESPPAFVTPPQSHRARQWPAGGSVYLGSGAEQKLFRDHFENRPDVLRHAAMDENETFLQLFACLRRNITMGRECGEKA